MRTTALLLTMFLLAPAGAAAEDKALPGKSYDYDYDGKDIGHPERAWLGRAYVPPQSASEKGPRPLLVFLHGLNAQLIEHRWMGGGTEGDVRRIVQGLVDDKKVAPMVVAAPSSVVASMVSKGASWNHFDLDHFVDQTSAALDGKVTIDESRIVVAGHSGAGCSLAGGLAKAVESKRDLHAIFSIDTCMGAGLAEKLAGAGASTHVVVSYQTASWNSRSFDSFRFVFERDTEKAPPKSGIFREIDHQAPKTSPHDQTVVITLEKWLPKIAPP